MSASMQPVFKFAEPSDSVVRLAVGLAIAKNASYAGLHFKWKNAKDRFFTYTCPCGVEVSYPLNGIPEVTTTHPCGVEGHYSVLVED